MSHYGNDDRFDHIFFYDSDDFLSSNKKILASQLEQFAEMFEKGRKRHSVSLRVPPLNPMYECNPVSKNNSLL